MQRRCKGIIGKNHDGDKKENDKTHHPIERGEPIRIPVFLGTPHNDGIKRDKPCPEKNGTIKSRPQTRYLKKQGKRATGITRYINKPEFIGDKSPDEKKNGKGKKKKNEESGFPCRIKHPLVRFFFGYKGS